MKFTNGGWMIKDGFEVDYAAHVYESKIENNKLFLYTPFKYTSHKGFTLDGGMFTIELTSPRKNIIGIKMYHFKGGNQKSPSFDLNTEDVHVDFNETDTHLYFISGDVSVEITKGEEFLMTFKRKGETLTESTTRSKSYIKDNQKNAHVSEQLTIDVGEYIYGLGERFTSFVKNGQTVDIWNEDAGTGTEQTYKNIPFYTSSKGYGVFVNSPDKVSFEVGSEKVSKVQFSVPGEMLDYYFMAGENLKEVLNLYTDLTGKPSLPPAWSFGLWLSTSFLTDYDEETVTKFIDGMSDRDIPLEVFHFDCLWMKEYEWCNFTWDERMFPNPKQMLQRLKEKGLKICVWINPYVGQKSPMFDEGMDNGYFLKRENGDVWQWDKWQAGLAVIDFTNPDAVSWYQNKLKDLLDMGVDCFKTDFGERIPTDVSYFNGNNPEQMHNYYAYLYNEVVFNLLKEVKGENEAVVFARSASVGSQKFPVHWGGDCTSDYISMAESLRAGLSFGLSGFGYWSHDIGGFEAGCSDDLYKRWTQFGLLSSHSRYHGSWEYKVPWLYGDEAVEVTKYFTKLKLALMPYLMTQAKIASEYGTPMMRAMILDFPQDIATHTLDRQYMFGEDLLVAPIFNDEGNGVFYLPVTEGKWTNFITNKEYLSGKWYNEKFDYLTLPLLAKPNSLIIEGSVTNKAEYNYTKNIIVHAFEIGDLAEAIVTDQIGNQVASITVRNISESNKEFEVEMDNLKNVTVLFRNLLLEDGEQCELGTKVQIKNNFQVIK